MFEKVKQAIHVGRHVTDIMRLPCVYSCHKEADGTLYQGEEITMLLMPMLVNE